MRVIKSVAALGVTLALCAFVAPTATPHDPCKVLTAEQFGKIMGYAATINKAVSTPMTCFYAGPKSEGGQFMILTEVAAGPGADRMVNRPGSAPPAGSGLVGGTFREGSIIFSFSVRSVDASRVKALADEIRKNLKK